MRLTSTNLSAKVYKEILPSSRIKIFRKAKIKSEENVTKQKPLTNESRITEYRENEMKIQMLSKSLYEQIFKQSSNKLNSSSIKQ